MTTKDLDGLCNSEIRWSERFADCLHVMDFTPCKAEPDIWMRKKGDLYEYIGLTVDSLAITEKEPKEIIGELQNRHNFKLKGTVSIAFRFGCDFYCDDDGILCMQFRKYIETMIEMYERLFRTRLSRKFDFDSPLEKGDHPEMDTSDLLDDDGTQLYQSLIGAMQWATSLTRSDIATDAMTLSGFRIASRISHLERAKRVYGHNSQFKDAAIRFSNNEPEHSSLPEQNFDWMSSDYGDNREALPNDIPKPLGKPFRITHYVDAVLFHDMVIGRSVTGIIDFLNQTPIDWFSKKQATVETTAYGSEFVTSRTCVERDVDLRTLLRYLGIPIHSKSIMFRDNELVVNSATTPHVKLHKRHYALSFHRISEAVSSRVIDFYHLKSEENPADILSKYWGCKSAWPLLCCLLFWKGGTIKMKDQVWGGNYHMKPASSWGVVSLYQD